MARKKVIRFIQAAFMVAAVVAAIPACTDDHFDVRDNAGEEGANATQTIWEQIQANPQLSKFATLVEKTPYFKDETHPISKADGTPYTFKDVLNGTQILTVFAPTNNAISDEEYQELLGKCTTDPYDVYLRIVGNHITKNRYTATGTGDEKLVMVNGKKAYFSRDRKLISGTQLSAATASQLIPLMQGYYNIPAVNGTLHVIDQQLPFHYNIYQYIKQHAEQFDSLRTWLISHDTIYFIPSLSVENGSDENGNPVYVDSFYTRSNTLYSFRTGSTTGVEWLMDLKGFSGNIEAEDSVWGMILPTDEAWRNAVDTYKKYYNYAPKYFNKYEQDTNPDATEEFVVNPDSIIRLAMNMDIASMLLFNIRQQPRTPQHPGYWTAEEFERASMFKMFNTRRDTFTIAKEVSYMRDTIPATKWVVDSAANVKALLTDNATPIAVSNGLLYPVNNWNFFKPFKSKDVEIKVSGLSIFQQTEMGITEVEYRSFPNANSALVTDSLLGAVSEDYFYKFSSTGDATVQFKLRDQDMDHDIMSGVKYRIGFVMVPDFYFWSTDQIIPGTKYKHKFTVTIKHLKGDKNGKITDSETDFRNKPFEYDGERVDTIWLADSKTGEDILYESNFSYKNLTRSYPVMTLKCSANPNDQKNGYNSDFCIDRIIFRAVDE